MDAETKLKAACLAGFSDNQFGEFGHSEEEVEKKFNHYFSHAQKRAETINRAFESLKKTAEIHKKTPQS